MARFLLVCFLVLSLGIACTSRSDEAAIRATVNGFWDAYNAKDYSLCLSYCTDVGDRNAALQKLADEREREGPATVSTGQITIDGSTAYVRVTTIINGARDTSTDTLRKNEVWKLVWQ